MKAIILAAGRGSRMGAVTDEKPKCMVEIGGKRLLDWQVAACRGAGIRDIGIVTGYRKEAFADTGFTLFNNPRWADTNMVRSLQCADAWLTNDPCIVSYADIFYDAEAVKRLLARGAPISLTYDVNWRALWEARFSNVLADAETFRINASGRITEIGNRAKTIEEIQGQYMGLLYFTPEGWRIVSDYLAALPAAEVDKLSMTGLLQQLIAAGNDVIGVPYDDRWGEVDNPEDVAAYAQFFKS